MLNNDFTIFRIFKFEILTRYNFNLIQRDVFKSAITMTTHPRFSSFLDRLRKRHSSTSTFKENGGGKRKQLKKLHPNDEYRHSIIFFGINPSVFNRASK